MQQEGKIRAIGVSTPEQDQNSVIDLMRQGWVDVVQVIYNIFEQEPAAELLPVAQACNVGIIARVVFDEGSLTGKWTKDTTFESSDFRNNYFAGDRLARSVARADKVRESITGSGYTLPQAALKFALSHPAVTTAIPGIRNPAQAEAKLRRQRSSPDARRTLGKTPPPQLAPGVLVRREVAWSENRAPPIDPPGVLASATHGIFDLHGKIKILKPHPQRTLERPASLRTLVPGQQRLLHHRPVPRSVPCF